jgi:hypothetical protein
MPWLTSSHILCLLPVAVTANVARRSEHFPFGARVELITYLKKYFRIYILKGSDDNVQHPKLLGFWTLSVVRYSRN